MSNEPWMIVGLGNPGAEYAATRHNVGFMVAERLADRQGAGWSRQRKARAMTASGRVGPLPGVRTVLVEPLTFMNLSGQAVAPLATYYKVPVERIVVIHDELDLPAGTLRLKRGGGDNGHNGLRSLRGSLGSGEFLRVRVGVGRPPGRQDPADYVLRPFAKSEQDLVGVVIEQAADAVEVLITEGLPAAQNRFN